LVVQPLDISPSIVAAALDAAPTNALPANEAVASEIATRPPPTVTSNSDRKKSPFGPSYQARPGPCAGRLSSGSTSRRIARTGLSDAGSVSV
jgi:hypothetical protein